MGNHGQTAIAEAFATLVGPQVGDEDIDLVRAALTIALTEYSDLNIESYVERIDELARSSDHCRSQSHTLRGSWVPGQSRGIL
jgi:hypothetical protein